VRATAAQADPAPGACTARDHPDPAPAQPRLARRDAATGTDPEPRRPKTVRSRPSAPQALMHQERLREAMNSRADAGEASADWVGLHPDDSQHNASQERNGQGGLR
jgi:hypothetical protein